MATASSDYSQPHRAFANHAKPYRSIAVSPIASAMGAEIEEVDLSAASDEQIDEISDALYRHKMIYFRDQELTFEAQESLTQRFGEFGVDAYTPGIEGHPNIQRVLKEADARAELIFGGSWHTDSPFLPRPPSLSFLYGVDIPPFGGDTLWANCVAAYDALSDTMKSMLAPLRVHMSGRRVFAALQRTSGRADGGSIASMPLAPAEQTLVDGALHPLIRTHPVTGELALYVDETYAVGIDGLSDYEAAPLLDFLTKHITQPLFTCRLRWTPKTFVMWDNRCCVHHAFNDHDGFRREMLRSIVEGEIPR